MIADLIDRWQAAGGPVLFSRYFNHADSPFVRLLDWTALQEAPETDIVPELAAAAARATAVIDKVTYGAFGRAVIDDFRDSGWSEVVLCGIATDSCVLKTAVDAFEADITPWIVTDACASEAGPDVHQAGLTVARRMVGARQLITTQDVADFVAPPAERSCA
ncbi:isochorismatase family cysteine hydrolase [Streptomyces atriruber]|uniref:isochorismatase family cysteine hydrolase n=1 Tax=Streptomyces atriruber TaxID=545121 RepID=UPI000A42D4ED|nr:isochorismatase family cysteine hydrolase [Streptomyces atriruber]